MQEIAPPDAGLESELQIGYGVGQMYTGYHLIGHKSDEYNNICTFFLEIGCLHSVL